MTNDERASWKITSRLEMKPLLIAVNGLAGGIVSVFYMGTLVGYFLDGYVSDRYGRIKSLGSSAVWGIIGAALQCTAMSPSWMVVSRLINGIGTGMLNATVPPRGECIAMEFTLNIFGVVVAYLLGSGLSYIDNALYVLKRLRELKNEHAAMLEMREIDAIVELENEPGENITYFHMIFGISRENLHIARRVQLVIWLQILQSWSGIAGATMYAPTIFKIAGFDSHKTMWVSGLNNIFYAFATLLCVFTLDRIGRRWILWWEVAGQAIAMFLAGGLARGGLVHPNKMGSWNIGATSMLTVPWLYLAEIFSLKVRVKRNACGVVGWSLGNGSLTLALPYIFGAIGENTLHMFGAVNLISIPITYTRGNGSYFATNSPWVWAAEANFQTFRIGNPNIGAARRPANSVTEVEKGLDVDTEHEGTVPYHWVLISGIENYFFGMLRNW
ncbi:MFS general substrate transporter [Aspergillus ruber CBS 135680]|uniref:MFS general substrate transporter n=1 Tax=Aspergillus ruber (strain CBS 135680) TaxID=1388766 RepID=A0A017SQD5_ASPRC|nr:MFS general substrate transporter [Aspergillus ruber CBS 135680]EYE99162.1 MFS general substrate transporter [Aspergillus ruber CBS 135680]